MSMNTLGSVTMVRLTRGTPKIPIICSEVFLHCFHMGRGDSKPNDLSRSATKDILNGHCLTTINGMSCYPCLYRSCTTSSNNLSASAFMNNLCSKYSVFSKSAKFVVPCHFKYERLRLFNMRSCYALYNRRISSALVRKK